MLAMVCKNSSLEIDPTLQDYLIATFLNNTLGRSMLESPRVGAHATPQVSGWDDPHDTTGTVTAHGEPKETGTINIGIQAPEIKRHLDT